MKFTATVWGPASNKVQADAQELISTAEHYVQSQASDIIGKLSATAGVTTAQLDRAESAINDYGGAAVASVGKLVTGGTPKLSDVAPLISMGLAATGVGAAAGAIVGVVAGALDAIASMVNAPPALDPLHEWTLPDGTVRHVSTGRPGGPESKDWVSWAQWEQMRSSSMAMVGFPLYVETIGWELPRLQAEIAVIDGKTPQDVAGQFQHHDGHMYGVDNSPVPDDAVKQTPKGVYEFYTAFYKAWQKAAEFAINGYNMPTPWGVFASTFNAWNASHAGPSVSLNATSKGPSSSIGLPNDPNGSSYVGQLLNGDIDGVHHADDIGPLNVGPVYGSTVRTIHMKKVHVSHAKHYQPSRMPSKRTLAGVAIGGAVGFYMAGPWGAAAGAALGSWLSKKI